MEAEITKLLDTLADALASLSTHIRGEKDEWGVKVFTLHSGWVIVRSKDNKAFLEVEITEKGTVHLRPIHEAETPTVNRLLKPSNFSFDLQPNAPSKQKVKRPQWSRDFTIEVSSEESEMFTELSTPGTEGHLNIPAMQPEIWLRGTKSWFESKKTVENRVDKV
jgi:hypothetical protein